MVAQRVIDAHGRSGVIHLLERNVVLLEFLERAQQPGGVAGKFDAAHVGQRFTTT